MFRIEDVTVEASSDQNGCTVSPENVRSFDMITASVEASLTVHCKFVSVCMHVCTWWYRVHVIGLSYSRFYCTCIIL